MAEKNITIVPDIQVDLEGIVGIVAPGMKKISLGVLSVLTSLVIQLLRGKKLQTKASQWFMYEAFQFIIKPPVDHLISLGVDPALKIAMMLMFSILVTTGLLFLTKTGSKLKTFLQVRTAQIAWRINFSVESGHVTLQSTQLAFCYLSLLYSDLLISENIPPLKRAAQVIQEEENGKSLLEVLRKEECKLTQSNILNVYFQYVHRRNY